MDQPGEPMNPLGRIVRWVKATAFASPPLFPFDILIASSWSKETCIVSVSVMLPDAVITAPRLTSGAGLALRGHFQALISELDDATFWSVLSGRPLGNPELIEIRSNLVGFMRALMAPGARLQ